MSSLSSLSLAAVKALVLVEPVVLGTEVSGVVERAASADPGGSMTGMSRSYKLNLFPKLKLGF